MCAHKLDVGDLYPVRKSDDKPVLVTCNVEDDPVVANDAGVSVLSFDIARGFPFGATGFTCTKFSKALLSPRARAFPRMS